MWVNPPDNLILKNNEAHVWRADLDVDKLTLVRFLDFLSADERRRANRFRFKTDYRRFIVSRGILRYLLGRYLQVEPQYISFQYSKYKKPSLKNNQILQFNISHSKHIALFAFTLDMKVGVDLEYINRSIELDKIAKRFFSPNEVSDLLELPKNQQVLGFFNCWTRKEAFIKAIGEGLSFPLNSFQVSLKPNQVAKLLATHWNQKDVSKWSINAVLDEKEFVGCLVVKGHISEVKKFQLIL